MKSSFISKVSGQHFLTSLNQIVDLTEKLHHKEDEFSSLCSELQEIKDTTLGK